jgi:hypothetical protein
MHWNWYKKGVASLIEFEKVVFGRNSQKISKNRWKGMKKLF